MDGHAGTAAGIMAVAMEESAVVAITGRVGIIAGQGGRDLSRTKVLRLRRLLRHTRLSVRRQRRPQDRVISRQQPTRVKSFCFFSGVAPVVSPAPEFPPYHQHDESLRASSRVPGVW